mmetsp:Transcript_5798/g.11620  ORF Transcript_5798/g.11620 Transcript_5798/m.11620 type:complete len:113 (+) Transcript_5798:301-639(+)
MGGACSSTKASRVTEENLTEPGTPPPEEVDSRSDYSVSSGSRAGGSRTYIDKNGKVISITRRKSQMGNLDALTLQNMADFEKDMEEISVGSSRSRRSDKSDSSRPVIPKPEQ